MLQVGFEEFLLDSFLPFILLFSIFYILLHQLKVFGDPSSLLVRRTNLLIALAISILVIWKNPLGISFRLFLLQLFSGTTIIILGLVFLIFFSALISLAIGGMNQAKWISLAAGLGLVILVFSTTGVMDYFQGIGLPRGLDFGVLGVIVLALIFFGILSWLFKP